MILRVPDYYENFQCTASFCKDSCCIGWEINIDEDTHAFYANTKGEFGNRLREHMYQNEDGEFSFRLGKKGRCPFLNSANLCDICIHMGEEALSEVCTEYPRFSLWYEDVLQKCLSLSCEEVGRMLFSKETPVMFIEMELEESESFETYEGIGFEEGESDEAYEGIDFDERKSYEVYEGIEFAKRESDEIYEDINFEKNIIWENIQEKKLFFEQIQTNVIVILQNRSISIEERIQQYLLYLTEKQEEINATQQYENNKGICSLLTPNYEQFLNRFTIFEELETLDEEWETVKKELHSYLTKETYDSFYQRFLESDSYCENDYEQLMVYFTFRYFMNSYYNMDILSYGKLAVVFTLMIKDMDIVRFIKNDDVFSRADRIDTVRIFSKEVEHSEENVEYVREELMFMNGEYEMYI